MTEVRTVGVEEELLLVDADGRAVSAAGTILRRQDASAGDGHVEAELQQEQVEVDTRPHSSLSGLAAEVVDRRREVARRAQEAGVGVAALGASPFPVDPEITRTPRYQRISRDYGLLSDDLLVCGMHVHVAVDSPDEGVGVLDRVRRWLPVLTALTTNSPFWGGQDTGHASYRYVLWSRWPWAGPTELFWSATRYADVVDSLVGSGVVMDDAMVYFDARLSATYPTVELRVADVCRRSEDAVTVAGLARALVETAARQWHDGDDAPGVTAVELRAAAWRAARSGLAGDLVDPRTGAPVPAGVAVGALLAEVAPALDDLGDADRVRSGVDELMARGSGAQEQRADHEESGDLAEVVRRAVAATVPDGAPD